MDYVKELEDFSTYLNGKVSEGTSRVYAHALELWFRQLNGNEPTIEAAQSFIDMQSLLAKPATVNLRARAIEKYFRYLYPDQEVHLKCPSVPLPDPQYRSLKEINQLLARTWTLLERVLITALFDTAVRINELLNLNVDDVDWENGFIRVRIKGGRIEQVNISQKALAVLGEWVKKRNIRSGKVFGNLSYYVAWSIIKKVGRRAGMDIHPHTFRHSRAAQMRLSGATMEDIRDHLNHKDIRTTFNIYGRLKAGDLKKRLPSW